MAEQENRDGPREPAKPAVVDRPADTDTMAASAGSGDRDPRGNPDNSGGRRVRARDDRERSYAGGSSEANSDGRARGGGERRSNRPNRRSNTNFQKKQAKRKAGSNNPRKGSKRTNATRARMAFYGSDSGPTINIGSLARYDLLDRPEDMRALAEASSNGADSLRINPL